MKILNLYAGIGGNRKLWNNEHEITAVEINPHIAKVYKSLFPNDTVVVADAHQYLLEHFGEFDFIWSSPPCPSHSKMRFSIKKRVFPDMKLYEEIIFLKSWFKGNWVVENVISYYEPLIKPFIIGRHYFWSNKDISNIQFNDCVIRRADKEELAEHHGFSLNIFDIIKDVPESRSCDNRFDRRQMLRNCVNPEVGLHILNSIK
jgi:DNA (cytosine-5)-methyltransferase 1